MEQLPTQRLADRFYEVSATQQAAERSRLERQAEEYRLDLQNRNIIYAEQFTYWLKERLLTLAEIALHDKKQFAATRQAAPLELEPGLRLAAANTTAYFTQQGFATECTFENNSRYHPLLKIELPPTEITAVIQISWSKPSQQTESC